MNNQNKIKNHFEQEAKEYDQIIINLIPYYQQIVDAVVASLPANKNAKLDILDLGCGTGTIAAAVKQAYPNAVLTCLDISQNMLDIAKYKLEDDENTSYILSNFYDFEFTHKYDAVVSSLALHHLENNDDKQQFYHKIYAGLKDNGCLINADVILAPTDDLQAAYMQAWRSFMIANTSEEEVDNKWIPTYYAEDRPITIKKHCSMLDAAGFASTKTVWKYNNFAVYMAVKRLKS